jgi:hypothetical protein
MVQLIDKCEITYGNNHPRDKRGAYSTCQRLSQTSFAESTYDFGPSDSNMTCFNESLGEIPIYLTEIISLVGQL